MRSVAEMCNPHSVIDSADKKYTNSAGAGGTVTTKTIVCHEQSYEPVLAFKIFDIL